MRVRELGLRPTLASEMDGHPDRIDRTDGLYRPAKTGRVDRPVRLQTNLARAQNERPGSVSGRCGSSRQHVVDGELEATELPWPVVQPVSELGTEREAGSHAHRERNPRAVPS